MSDRVRIQFDVSAEDWQEMSRLSTRSRLSLARISSLAVSEFLERHRGEQLVAVPKRKSRSP